MDPHSQLWTELGALLRGLKDLNAFAIEESGVRVELSGVTLLGRLALIGPARLTELAASLGLDPSSVSRQVAAVERSGYVAREDDPSDGRATRLVLTAQGREVVDAVHAKRAEALVRLTPGWSDSDVDRLTGLIARLNHDIASHRHLLDVVAQETA